MPTLTPLAIVALALLAERPMHPYEMYQTLLKRREDRNVKVRPGSLYHTVDRLEGQGLVEAQGVDRAGNRPERTTYAITDEGRRLLEDRVISMVATPAEEYPEFQVALGEAHMLTDRLVVELLTRRREAIAAKVEMLEASGRTVTAIQLPSRYWLDASYQLAILRADLAWLDATIPAIRDGSIDWTTPIPDHLKEATS